MPHQLPRPTVVTVDTLISSRPVMFFGVVVWASGVSGRIAVYDASEADSTRLVGTFVGAVTESTPVLFPWPVPLPGGLFVDVVIALQEAQIYWRPMTPEEESAIL